MTKKERKKMAREIEQSLKRELNFHLDYEISDYHEEETSIVDVDIDISDSEDWPDDWDDQVEDVISEIAEDWGGWCSWDGWCISVSVSDEAFAFDSC